MEIIDVFEQPRTDDHIYVVTVGALGNDIACYVDNKYTRERGNDVETIARHGTKISAWEFKRTLGGLWLSGDSEFFYRS